MLPAATGGAASGARRGLAGGARETRSEGRELAAGGWEGEGGTRKLTVMSLKAAKARGRLASAAGTSGVRSSSEEGLGDVFPAEKMSEEGAVLI